MATLARLGMLAALVTLLVGCTVAVPPGATDRELEQYQARILELSWEHVALAGEPPVVESRAWADEGDWLNAIVQCLTDAGVQSSGWGFSAAEGYMLQTISGDDVDDPEVRLAFYLCVAANPLEANAERVPSAAQLDYVYDHLLQWMVPCLEEKGFSIKDAPTREQFAAMYGQWSPMWQLPTGVTPMQLNAIEEQCGSGMPRL